MNGRNPPSTNITEDGFRARQRGCCTAGRGVPTVEECMQEQLLRAALCGQSHCCKQLLFMTMNATGR